MTFTVELGAQSYDVTIGKNLLKRAGTYFNLNRKVLIVTDSGVPRRYTDILHDECAEGYIVSLPCGEENKNMDMLTHLLSFMVEKCFTRTDCVVAVGGGVVGDIAGFAAAIYMRGIDFYNIPTTTLSQIDSSIGGKTAIDFMDYKNIIGAFHQPKGVIVDTSLVKTQDERQFVSGLAEGVKMAATFDEELFSLFEEGNALSHYEEIVTKALLIKKQVVEKDEKESGLRRALNFGHTVGHAIEKRVGLGALYHGECVALGMMYTSRGEAKKRIAKVLRGLGLPTKCDASGEELIEAISHDKKASGGSVGVVLCEKIGSFKTETMTLDEISCLIKEGRAL